MSHWKRDPLTGAYESGTYYVKIDRVNSSLSYVGKTKVQGESVDNPVWQVARVFRVGSTTTTEFAKQGSFKCKWSDRSILFPDLQLDNSLSSNFNGINGRVSFGNAFNYDVAQVWSLSLWFKIDNYTSQRCLYSKATPDTAVTGYGVYVTTSGNIFLQVRAPSTQRNHFGTAVVPTQEWVHLAITYSGGSNMNGFRIYLNGIADTVPGSATLASVLANQDALLGIRGSSFPWSGNIDEVSFWGKTLTPSEVTDLYNLGGGIISNTTGLNHYYRMGDGDPYPAVIDNQGVVDGVIFGGVTFVEDTP